MNLEEFEKLDKERTQKLSYSLRAGGQPVYGLKSWGVTGCATLLQNAEDAKWIAACSEMVPKLIEVARAAERVLKQQYMMCGNQLGKHSLYRDHHGLEKALWDLKGARE